MGAHSLEISDLNIQRGKKPAKIVIIRKTDDELPNKSVSKIAIGFMIDGGAGNGIIHH